MTHFFKTLAFVLFLGAGQLATAQTEKEKAAYSKAVEGIELVDQGKVDEGIKLLQAAQKMDPARFTYPYEIAYAYYAKQDYKSAIKILEKNKNHMNVEDKLFQLLGNSYDLIGKQDKAIIAYDEGLKKFPNSGAIYLEKGNLLWAKKEYIEALPFYEKGIEVDPEFPSNYYRAARIYCSSTEEVWGMIYGEIFMNIERNSKRTEEMSKLLFDTYKSEIKIVNDTSYSVSFSQNASINMNDLKKLVLPFGMGAYEPILSVSVLSAKTIDINSLDVIRTNFVDNYYSMEKDKEYPNMLFDYQRKVKDAGHLEAYNHWILMKGDQAVFDAWLKTNKTKWEDFINWFTDNGMEVSADNHFHSSQY